MKTYIDAQASLTIFFLVSGTIFGALGVWFGSDSYEKVALGGFLFSAGFLASIFMPTNLISSVTDDCLMLQWKYFSLSLLRSVTIPYVEMKKIEVLSKEAAEEYIPSSTKYRTPQSNSALPGTKPTGRVYLADTSSKNALIIHTVGGAWDGPYVILTQHAKEVAEELRGRIAK